MTPRHEGSGRLRPVPRNWKSYTIIGLLILIPLLYIFISTQQSRDSGRDKATRAGATGMTKGWPSRVQRRVYDLSVPEKAKKVSFYETNSWNTSTFFVEFRTTPKKLDILFDSIGIKRADLEKGMNPITNKEAREVGWTFADGSWWGVHFKQPGPKPEISLVVDRSKPGKPKVRAVSTTTF